MIQIDLSVVFSSGVLKSNPINLRIFQNQPACSDYKIADINSNLRQ